MILNSIDINSSEVAVRKQKIYIISIMKPEPMVYVGQTCDKWGFRTIFPTYDMRNID